MHSPERTRLRIVRHCNQTDPRIKTLLHYTVIIPTPGKKSPFISGRFNVHHIYPFDAGSGQMHIRIWC